MRSRKFFAVATVGMLMLTSAVTSQVPLCPSDCDQLSPEANMHYNKALEYMDRVYMEGALEELRKAAKADPNHINLNFLLARVARDRGKMATTLENARRYYTIAENTLLHIKERENLSIDQKYYLENVMSQVNKEKAALSQRQHRRYDVGYQIIIDYAKDIGRIEKPEEKEAGAETGEMPTAPEASASPFGASPFGASPSPSTSSSPFGGPSTSSSPFGAPEAPASTTAPSPFGASSTGPSEETTAPSTSPFGTSEEPSEEAGGPASSQPAENPFDTQ